MESEGKVGKITFIDAAPALSRTFVSLQYESLTDEQIQNKMIEALAWILWEKSVDVQSITSLPSWDEKISKVLTFVTDQEKYGKEYLRIVLNAAFNRSKIALYSDIKISSLTRTKATLIRPTVAWVSKDIDEKYDLQVNFQKDVHLIRLEGNHFTLLENPSLLKVIQKIHLENGKC